MDNPGQCLDGCFQGVYLAVSLFCAALYTVKSLVGLALCNEKLTSFRVNFVINCTYTGSHDLTSYKM
ncbi:hypothetical protein [Escherichia coli]|uniref:hypothetical protein n=1 Tax=Escherichia coli TaxID=562 RepID=UPI0038B24F7F